ncbi:hypothetical protein L202_06441 [Cryptococcus amylolentus CBS 6039]|uniref:CRIB domain-containing protein n=2 Tax=Cryptococcus amylolentus CBS 6039 TaxID=1295533 RepID=A0A1E3HFY5_9TREE|nr:hypothetical protein L202_06441 [Cryptococcus amylolentus CBS 6039]ODN75250.1 hypothetical protein L202_06441 [Cryptococcus amylolentus CBS 6039]
MAPRTPTTADSNKKLPAVPLDALGLDLHGRGLYAGEGSCTTGSGDENHRRSARQQASSNTGSISPITTSSTRSASRYPYTNQSSSTLTTGTQNYSTTTLTVPGSPSRSVASSQTSVFYSEGPETPVSKRRVMFQPQASPSLRSEQTSTPGRCARPDRSAPPTPSSGSGNSGNSAPVPLTKKRSSSQLLMGIGKGIGRVGSVMRRNTAEGTSSHGSFSAPGSAPSSATSTPRKGVNNTGTWRKRGKMPSTQEQVVFEGTGWESMDRNEGDSGIGRPFNVEHDLHVSPDLQDLPPAWLSSLKAQGLSESDLLLISSARKRQHTTPDHHVAGDDFLRAPHSAPVGPSNEPYAYGTRDSQSSRASSATGMLRKFSFEVDRQAMPTAHGERLAAGDVFGGHPTTNPKRISRRIPSDSYPVSATESEVSESEYSHHQHRLPTTAPHTTSPSNRSRSVSDPNLLAAPTPRQTKRLSAQLRGFKDLPIGDAESARNGEWTKSILGMGFAWEEPKKYEESITAEKAVQSADSSGVGKALNRSSKLSLAPKQSRPCTPESLPKKIARKPPPKEEHTPPSSASGTAREFEPASASTTTPFPHSPPPPKRPGNGHRRGGSGFSGSASAMSSSGSGSGGHHTNAFVSSREVYPQGPQLKEVEVIREESGERAVAIPRTSSESFGVHYSSPFKSRSSVELDLITPSTSDGFPGLRAHGADHVEQVDTGYAVDYSSDDEEHDFESGFADQSGSAKKKGPKDKRQTFGHAPPPHGRDLPRLSIDRSPSLPQIGVSPLDVDASTFGKSPISPSPEPAVPGLPLSPPPSYSPLPLPKHLSAPHRNSTSSDSHGYPNRDSLQSTFSRYSRDSRTSMRSDRTSRTSHQSLKSWELGEVAHVRHVACKGMVPSYNVSSASLGDLMQNQAKRSPEIDRLGDRGVERLDEESEYGESEDGARDALDALGQAAQRIVQC